MAETDQLSFLKNQLHQVNALFFKRRADNRFTQTYKVYEQQCPLLCVIFLHFSGNMLSYK